MFKTTKDLKVKLAKYNKVTKRKANDFPGHYPMTRKAKLKTAASAPMSLPTTLKQIL